MQTGSNVGRRFTGAVGLVAMVTLVGAGIGSYSGWYSETVPVTVRTDRAGLIMEPGNAVTVRGVTVGEVDSVDPDGEGGAVLHIALDPQQAQQIPADATAQVEATTVFGPKTIALVFPIGSTSPHIEPDAQLEATGVPTELNDVLGGLHGLLTTVDVSKLNSALGATSQALEGRGTAVGEYAADLDRYLSALNRQLPTIRGDIAAAADVTGTYADATDDILSILRNSTVTSETLVGSQSSLHTALLGLTTSARNGEEFVRLAGPPLVTALEALRPVARLLVEFAPEVTCTIEGLDHARIAIGEVFGSDSASLQGSTAVLPGQQAYQRERDLPKLVSGLGPDCYELPRVREAALPLPRYLFDDGAQNVFSGNDDSVSLSLPGITLYDSLFGSGKKGNR